MKEESLYILLIYLAVALSLLWALINTIQIFKIKIGYSSYDEEAYPI